MLAVKKIQILMFTFLCFYITSGTKCKWSNEDCSHDSECCSKSCEQAHPGTNNRCTQNRMNSACIYHYHCDDRLICGPDQRCCADEWGSCMEKSHCCDPEHDCIDVESFVYKRCLKSSDASFTRTITWAALLLGVALVVCGSQMT